MEAGLEDRDVGVCGKRSTGEVKAEGSAVDHARFLLPRLTCRGFAACGSSIRVLAAHGLSALALLTRPPQTISRYQFDQLRSSFRIIVLAAGELCENVA